MEQVILPHGESGEELPGSLADDPVDQENGYQQHLLAEAIRDITSALTSTLELDQVLDRIFTHLERIIPHDAASIALIDGGVVRTYRQVDHDIEFAHHQVREVQMDAVMSFQQMTQARHPISIPDTYSDPRWLRLPGLEWIRAYLGSPLISGENVLGFLNLESATRYAFSDGDVTRLQAFANSAAIAIRNAQLIQMLEQSRTELRQMHGEMVRTERLRAAGENVAEVAHQISNPLAVVIGQAHRLMGQVGESTPPYRAAQLIYEASSRVGRVADRILDFFSQQSYHFGPMEINRSIENVLPYVQNQNDPDIFKIETMLGTGLPLLDASQEYLEDVWLNLLINARDAVRDNPEGRIVIRSYLADEGDAVEVTIEDNGVGIPSDELTNIFSPFYTTKIDGTGLGLSICMDIIKRHHGSLSVESDRGIGTRFIVRLPISIGGDGPHDNELLMAENKLDHVHNSPPGILSHSLSR